MRPFDYFKTSVWDFLFCMITSSTLSFMVCSGFYISTSLHYNYPLIIGCSTVLLLVLFLIAYNQRTAVFGSLALAVVAIAALVIGVSLQGGANIFVDDESNPTLFFVVVFTTALLVFLLSRRKGGTIVLAVGGILTGTLVEFLYDTFHLIPFLVFLVALAALFIYRNYSLKLKGTVTKKSSFIMASLVATTICLVALGGSLGVFYGVIAPQEPGVRELKLITKYMAYEELHLRGINADMAITDPDLTTALLNDQTEAVQEDQGSDQSQEADQNTQDDDSLSQTLQNLGSMVQYSADGAGEFYQLITYSLPSWLWPMVIALLLALILGAVLLKRLFRRRWIRKVQTYPPKVQAQVLYHFYLDELRRMKIVKPPQASPYEFAASAVTKLVVFSNNTQQVGFIDLTRVFMKAAYSDLEIRDEELGAYRIFHADFYRNCIAYLGRFKYCFKFFRL